MATVTGSASLAITSLSTCNNVLKLVGGTTMYNEPRALIIVNNKPLTDHGRTIQIGYNFSVTENTNWNGTRSRYFRRASSSGKNSWSISWKMVPGTKRDTADGRYGRDYFKELASGEDVYTLKLIKVEDGTYSTYTVFVEAYNENLIRRDLINNVYYWDCSIVFNEA